MLLKTKGFSRKTEALIWMEVSTSAFACFGKKPQLNKILKRPFYCGRMETKYGAVEHRYAQLTSK